MAENAGEMEEFVRRMNEEFASAVEQNVRAQTEFVESWSESMRSMTDDDLDGVEGYVDAYEVWMDAAERTTEQFEAAAEGEPVDPGELRDLWLSAANDAFKEVMSTPAFAAVTGETVGEALDVRQQVDEATEDTLHAMGLATEGDVREVGRRLVELERRQHEVENKLDRILDELE